MRSLLLLACLLPNLAVAQRPVRGVVLDERGEPLAGVAVCPFESTARWTTAALAEKAPVHTDREGRFEITAVDPIFAEHWDRVLFVAPGRLVMAVAKTHALVGPVVLPRGHVLSGRVRDATGRPVAGVRVLARDFLWRQPFLTTKRSARPDPEPMTAVTTDDGGRFVLLGACATAAEIRVDGEGWLLERRGPVSIMDPLDVTVRAAPIVSVRILDTAGRPRPGTRATIQESGGDRLSWSVTSDAAGRVRTTWRGATLRVQVRMREDDVVRYGALVLEQTVREATLQLRERTSKPRQGPRPPAVQTTDARVRVRVVGPGGKPSSRFRAGAWHIDAEQQRHRTDARQRKEFDACAMTADNGVAELQVHKGGGQDTLLVLVQAEGMAMGRATAAAGAAEMTVTLEPAGVISGAVVDSVTGAPVVGARVWVMTDWERTDQVLYQGPGDWDVGSQAVTSDATGAFRLDNLRGGDQDIFCTAEGYAHYMPKRVVVAAGTAIVADPLQLAPLRDVPVDVRGRLPAGARILRFPRYPKGSYSPSDDVDFSAAVSLDDDGRFVARGMAPGRFDAQLLLPRLPRQGIPDKVSLAVVEVTTGTKRLELDTGRAVPAIVRGRVSGNVPPQRLAVLSAPKQRGSMSYGFLKYDGPYCPVALDGRFELRVPPDDRTLIVFDVWTGAMLHREAEAAIEPGSVHDLELVVDAAAVEFTLGGADYDEHAFYWLEIVPSDEHWPAGVGLISTTQRGQFRRKMGTALFPGQSRGVLYLPAAPTTLRVGHNPRGPYPPWEGFALTNDFDPSRESSRRLDLRLGK